ncbi:hypothetical protein E1A91_D01G000400v1 [Gossypium mustelinum]|uniref:Uncharacterized protein n=2 Tax=Gossypium TaxID=3633 RepID=A0A5D2W1T8_GOSMU|nr:hypothetical protein ES332_D01G000600v1 [Gossypium tomentosum]TYI95473.1 hypothetical protein E1A91_D01G000400v1 [Gossypium mustelinum]
MLVDIDRNWRILTDLLIAKVFVDLGFMIIYGGDCHDSCMHICFLFHTAGSLFNVFLSFYFSLGYLEAKKTHAIVGREFS